ncbi:MAG: glycosyltransferase family A protein [Sphingopyxis sp.]|uniref:glycosyltransferase family A protein n=1 Tax=Sphingopyxis sp. TaxID=1908224 RepID=UPI002AB9B270|nr:glycosyltransferase family A protein [Sphingopyxis sp.]MDZ3831487.1 glycosyltransferase family A protein [Sphingopyxis sp.]
MNRIVNKLNAMWKERRLHAAAKKVLDTPPLEPSDDGLILFSMIGTRVLLPYLVAVKSLHARLQRGRIVILDDGTLTDRDRAILAAHLGHPRIIAIADVDTGPCPRGGTWERLLTLLDLRADDYVIQLDSDTVTLGDVSEIAAAIAANRSFTLRGDAVARIMPFDEMASMTDDAAFLFNPAAHVQGAIESGLDRVPMPMLDPPLYVRGCSGFAGFARGAGGRTLAESFSRGAAELLGAERWARWGSEQVTSNMVVANEPDALLLPYDRYLNFWDEGVPQGAAFVHFIGTYRFSGHTYIDATRRAVRSLSAR